jgi:serine-type D-Ala-D-Ala carboxypeptidase/endopeptidase (penicillin-binding protein 4)
MASEACVCGPGCDTVSTSENRGHKMSSRSRLAVIVSIALGVPALAASTALGQALHDEPALRSAIAAQMAQGPRHEGALVVDLGNGHTVFADHADTSRPTASLMKLFTTSAALMRLGTRARLTTRVFASGRRQGDTLAGDLYLRGGGDFTFGTASFDRGAYGGGGTVEALAAAIRNSGVRRIQGSVYGDASLFSDGTGTPFNLVLCSKPLFGPGCPYGPAGRLERLLPWGPRTAISFDRGLVNQTSARPQRRPVRFAAQALINALKADGVRVDGRAGARRTPTLVTPIAQTQSPPMSRLITLINRPSDNYAADVLLRDLGSRLEGQGSGAAGAIAVNATVSRFGLHPHMVTGSGESVRDSDSPGDVVGLLRLMHGRAEGAAFAHSLSQAGRNGSDTGYAHTPAAGRCQLKGGTHVGLEQSKNTLNVSGYCRSIGGRRFAFAVMMTGLPMAFVPPDRIVSPGYALQRQIVVDLANYRG